MAFVSVRAIHTMRGTAANHVKMKLKGSGSCTQQQFIISVIYIIALIVNVVSDKETFII